jgi:amidohydrolase
MVKPNQIKALAKEFFSELKEIREHLHQYPELSFEEYETAKFLKQKLDDWGIKVDRTWVDTGFSVVINGGAGEGETIALRADLDALPIEEQSTAAYASKNPGKMHACGHDVHAACLMGVIKILDACKQNWKGKVVCFFQAGEEKLPGGASLMIKEGIIETYKPKTILAQHVYPEFEVGHVGFKSGMYMASADEIYLSVIGKGGHAALPHRNVDPVLMAASLVLNLQKVVSRIAPPTVPTVLSFGKIEGKGATNVIPDKVELAGTLRTMNESWRAIFHEKIESISQHTCKSFGGECMVDIQKGYPFLVNDEQATKLSESAALAYLSKSQVHSLDLRMTAEDFAYFSQHAKVCFYRLGVGNSKKGITHSVHHPKFDIDERALEIGSGLMAFLALTHLS